MFVIIRLVLSSRAVNSFMSVTFGNLSAYMYLI